MENMNDLIDNMVTNRIIDSSITDLTRLLEGNKIPFNDPKVLRRIRKFEKLLASRLARHENNMTECDLEQGDTKAKAA